MVPIDIATNTAGTPIPLAGLGPQGIAITPNGSRAYVTDQNSNQVSVIDLATNAEIGSPIGVGGFPQDVAITPDGTRAYVADQGSDDVVVIDLASGTVIATIVVGSGPRAIAITPSGTRAYVANANGDSVSVIDLATNTVAPISSVGDFPFDIAITPNGALAYVVNAFDDSAAPIDVAAGTVGAAVPVDPFPVGIAITPNGSNAYATSEVAGSVTPIAVGGAAGTPIPVVAQQGSTEAIAIVPNQGPHAAFSSSPHKPKVKKSVAFNGGGSTDSDGSVARYDWEFGDGKSAANAGATPHHSYARAGTYKVTLTTTDNEGCSTTIVFTGQTAYCNGSSAARVTHSVTVVKPKAKPHCPTVRAGSSSFVPRFRPGPTVPGVRVRLFTSRRSRLDIGATLVWFKHNGHRRGAHLRSLSVRVRRWRRVRFPIPDSLLGRFPVGSKVRVRLRIEAHPLGAPSSCGGVTHRTLHLRVVKVFPNAVQHGRVQ